MSLSIVKIYLIVKVIGVIVAIALITTISYKFLLPRFSSKSETVQSTNSSVTPLPNTEKTVDDLVKEKFGDKAAAIGNILINVHSIAKKDELSNGLSNEKAQGEFIVIGLLATNLGKETEMANNSMFTLVDDQQRRYDPSTSAALTITFGNNDLKPFIFTQVQPGLPTEGFVVFDIPKEANHLQLAIKQDFSNEEKLIPLDSFEQEADAKAAQDNQIATEKAAQAAANQKAQNLKATQQKALDDCLAEVSAFASSQAGQWLLETGPGYEPPPNSKSVAQRVEEAEAACYQKYPQ